MQCASHPLAAIQIHLQYSCPSSASLSLPVIICVPNDPYIVLPLVVTRQLTPPLVLATFSLQHPRPVAITVPKFRAGYGIEDLLFVTRYKISKRLESLEGTIKFIQDDVERRFKELAGSLAYYKYVVGSFGGEVAEQKGTFHTFSRIVAPTCCWLPLVMRSTRNHSPIPWLFFVAYLVGASCPCTWTGFFCQKEKRLVQPLSVVLHPRRLVTTSAGWPTNGLIYWKPQFCFP